MDQDESEKQSATALPKDDEENPKVKSLPDMPWSDFHSYALRDNLPRYTRVLPGETPKTYALWRTMLQEVPELSGYPIEFLREKFTSREKDGSEDNSAVLKAPEVLPFLDSFYFEPSGGLSGQVRTADSRFSFSINHHMLFCPLMFIFAFDCILGLRREGAQRRNKH